MPRRNDLHKILIIGSGPIVIGQGCEFDYSGTQACKALREEGYQIVLINSNPATIMTDPEFADRTYIEPITPEAVAKIIEKERPDALLPTLGGQTGLNTAVAVHDLGVLAKFNVEMIGATREVIERAENRTQFKRICLEIGLDVPRSGIAHTMDEARKVVAEVGLPVCIRPAYTLGGTGGGFAFNVQEFETIAARGLEYSPISEILIEESVLGWKEYELEVMRDKADNVVIVCSIENFDPMGVHTGDSITVAPAQTLTDKEYQLMRDAAIAIIRAIGVETGGSNIQFAIEPTTGRMIVVEMNPRVSRSSALASKATGFPIAKIAAKLAVGYTLDEVRNDITRETPACFEPTIDYVVTKIPRWTFEKFPDADETLTTQMKSVGEAMSIGRTFKESLQKGIRSMEVKRFGLGLDRNDKWLKSLRPPQEIAGAIDRSGENTEYPIEKSKLRRKLAIPSQGRMYYIRYAFKMGWSVDNVFELTRIDRWFLTQMKQLVDFETQLHRVPQETVDVADLVRGLKLADPRAGALAALLRQAKQWGYSDVQLATIWSVSEMDLRAFRKALGIEPVYKLVDTCAAEFEAYTPYYYSSYETPIRQVPVGGQGSSSAANPPSASFVDDEARVSSKPKIVILGGGPNRIGQGIEFDYCCVHAAFAARELGYESVMVNSNPETVSTDYDTSDMLFFEPLTQEDVLNICEKLNGKPLKKKTTTEGTGNTERREEALVVDLSGTAEGSCLALSVLAPHRNHVVAAMGSAVRERSIGPVGIVQVGIAQEVATVLAADKSGKCWGFDFLWKEQPPVLRSVNQEERTEKWDWLGPEVTGSETAKRLKQFFTSVSSVPSVVDSDAPGYLHGVIVQFGGQTPLNLAAGLARAGVPIIGTSVDSIDMAEDRKRFAEVLDELKLHCPPGGTAFSVEQAREVAKRIGYPVLVRPSYVLGGRAMEIVSDEQQLDIYMAKAVDASTVGRDHPILVDKFLGNATEVDVDCISDFGPRVDGTAEKNPRAVVCGVMEHIEEAGIHSGDSACSLPPFSLSEGVVAEIERQARLLAQRLRVRGLMNIQFAVKDSQVYILEVNPRASRTVPFVSKATGVPWAKLAAKVMAGKSLEELGVTEAPRPAQTSVKESVFPFTKFPGVDVILGPEMRSTGEVMGIDMSFGLAFAKSQFAAGVKLPTSGTIFLSVNKADKPHIVSLGQQLAAMGFNLIATGGTYEILHRAGVRVKRIYKLSEGRPNIADLITNGQVNLLINTPTSRGPATDEGKIRAMATMHNLPLVTTLTGAEAVTSAIAALKAGAEGGNANDAWTVRPLQEYFPPKP